jgi:hypothetical protein
VRSVIGECLHAINELGGRVVSVTTDGFITDVEDLESKIDGYLLHQFQSARVELSGDGQGLELKNAGCGVMAWSTRGQMGYGSKILATTGFQHTKYFDKRELFGVLESVMKSDAKVIEYQQSSLRSASEIYKKGGHVTMKYRDQLFRMHFDNRRVLAWETSIPSGQEVLIDSTPITTVKEGENLRFIGSLVKKKLYGKYTSSVGKSKYSSSLELVVRSFVKGAVSTPPDFNLPECFDTGVKLMDFVKSYNPEIKLSLSSI